jgi:hypothetical protein
MPANPTVLISEDHRTEEEKQQEQEREALALTYSLFTEETPGAPSAESSPVSVDLIYSPPGLGEDVAATENTNEEEEVAVSLPALPILSKLATYIQIVQLAQDEAATVTASPPIRLSQRITMSVLIFEAKQSGLRAEEIELARVIGEQRAKAQKRRVQPAVRSPMYSPPVLLQPGMFSMRTSTTRLELSKF